MVITGRWLQFRARRAVHFRSALHSPAAPPSFSRLWPGARHGLRFFYAPKESACHDGVRMVASICWYTEVTL